MANFFTSSHKDLRWFILVSLSIGAMHSRDLLDFWPEYLQLFSSWYWGQFYGVQFICWLFVISLQWPQHFPLILFSHIMELAGMRSWEHTLSCLLSQLLKHKVCLLAYGLRWSTHPVKEPFWTPKLANRRPLARNFSISWKCTSTKQLTE